MNRKKDSGHQILRNLCCSVAAGERYGWTVRRTKTTQLDIRELLRRLGCDSSIPDSEINGIMF